MSQFTDAVETHVSTRLMALLLDPKSPVNAPWGQQALRARRRAAPLLAP